MQNTRQLMNDLPNQEKKKSVYKEYWEGISSENAFVSMDSHVKGLCVACKSSCSKKSQANQQLDGQTKKCQSPPSGYVFDR